MDVRSDHIKTAPRGIGWPSLLMKQIRYQWAVSLLLAMALCGVVALYTYARNSAGFQHRSIQLIEKDAGHNLWFIHASASLFDAVSGGADLPSFSDGHVHVLAGDRRVASTYWGNVLQERILLQGREVLLTGLEVVSDQQVTEEKAHLFEPLAPSESALGASLAQAWGVAAGDRLVFGEREYLVQRVHAMRGNLDDERLWIPLPEAQDWLDKPRQANLILGFLCMRGLSLEEGLARLRHRLGEEHAGLELRVVPLMSMLESRAMSRVTTSRYLEYLLLAVLLVSGLLMAAIGWMEVNERRYELAILMAMGSSYRFLFLLFLGKMLLLAAVASLSGFLLGSFLYIHWLSPVLVVHTQPVSMVWSTLPPIFLLTLGWAGVAAVVPLIHLMRLDPTRILAEE